jgi:hypothetical protein
MTHKALPASPPKLADDLLRGADQIAKFLFGSEGRKVRAGKSTISSNARGCRSLDLVRSFVPGARYF